MQCPVCDAKTRVDRTKLANQNSTVRRWRVCESGHAFETRETRAGYRAADVLVRRTGGGDLVPFDRQRLLRDLKAAVLKRLTAAQSEQVVSDTVHTLETRLPEMIKLLTPAERETWPRSAGWIRDTTIASVVAQHLRTGPDRMAHVMYGMTIEGREDHHRPKPFHTASDVLNWLAEDRNYPDLKAEIPYVPRGSAYEQWYSHTPPPTPERVIKASGQIKPFVLKQFVASVQRALLGRQDAEERGLQAAFWVLWQLRGQPELLTAQLASGVMQCLRRVDDIAYLRWAITFKDIDTVTRFKNEAAGLIQHPAARRIVFNPTAELVLME